MQNILIFLLLRFVQSSSFHINIARYSTECFYEALKSGDRLEVSYEVTSSTAEYDIDYKINNPDGSKLHLVDRSKDASFGFNAGADGKHEMCFYNLHSGADKVISFIIIGPDDRLTQQSTKDTPEEEKRLHKDMNTLLDEYRLMLDEIEYLNRRIARHQSTAVSTNSRVFYWTLFEIIILVGASYLQVTYLRQFFEKKRLI